MDVTVIGDLNLDIISSPMDEYPAKDRQIILPRITQQLGGSAAIFACACSKLGLKTKFIGRLGFDFTSDFLIEEMRKLGVEVRVKRVEGETAGITISLNFKDGKRAMMSFVGSNQNLSLHDFDLDEIGGKVLHIGGFNLLESLRKDVFDIFQHARRNGIKTSLDPNWDPRGWKGERLKDLLKILKITDFFFPDYEEGRAITKNKNPEKIVKILLKLGARIVALKCGKNGCLVGREGEIFKIRGLKVKAIQATGAGDAFNAGFIKAFLSGFNLLESGRFANACGAFYTTKLGSERFTDEKVIKGLMESCKA